MECTCCSADATTSSTGSRHCFCTFCSSQWVSSLLVLGMWANMLLLHHPNIRFLDRKESQYVSKGFLVVDTILRLPLFFLFGRSENNNDIYTLCITTT